MILDIWIFGYLDIWIFGILEFWDFRFWENWKKITKVVFAIIRSGKDKDNKNKENAHPLTMAILSGVGRGKNYSQMCLF